ncbi:GntR family transcriptional regulator [Oceanicola granulosus HTCC2516]|uniref:GntR family transcriptional regulator n=1 Tax=Oceanicola granulosus (strain ATCC BAA-861 / DSM 15982 / KCTC 12143 / HTCC2516) TaxID=314256 RepID=Q2CGV4_OCEGH|nr:GntR family transcriptional regulator [Oceanicola granulosus]EAR51831.1 GntR family transcriptional regulator [Oceanicola granulosus HTCC2516]
MPDSKIISRTAAPLRQQVLKRVREEIVEGRLAPGMRLVESALCESYGVSRTVVREALRQLESEHLVNVVPNAGPIVAVLTEEEIRSIYVVRATLEALAGKLFAQHADANHCKALVKLGKRLDKEYRKGTVESREAIKAEFYERLLDGAQNRVLTEDLRAMHARIAIFRRFAFVDEARTEPSLRELETIIRAAAVDRDAQAAWNACEHHILLAGELAIHEYMKRHPDVAKD